ncbi:S9 family peptidase [bacterium]|nr:S9 family peptidase [bacterium]
MTPARAWKTRLYRAARRRRAIPLGAALVAALLVAMWPAAPGKDADGQGFDDGGDDDDTPAPGRGDAARLPPRVGYHGADYDAMCGWLDDFRAGANIDETDYLGDFSELSCAVNAHRCVRGYEKFLDRNRSRAREITQARLDDMLTVPPPLFVKLPRPDVLAKKLANRLNIEFLLDRLERRRMTVEVVSTRVDADSCEKEILILDEDVGAFRVVILAPRDPEEFLPAIVAAHGHGDSIEIFRTDYGGETYPAHGYLIAMVSGRAMLADKVESDISRRLLLAGFSLLSLHVYEQLLAHRYVASLTAVEPDRIGLIGHSGGAVVANVTVRVRPRAFHALVSDSDANYLDRAPNDPYQNSTVPAIYAYSAIINQFSTAPLHVLRPAYGFVDPRTGTSLLSQIFEFWDKYLNVRKTNGDAS